MVYKLSGSWHLQPCEDPKCSDETVVYKADINEFATIVIDNPGGPFDNLWLSTMQEGVKANSVVYVDGSGHEDNHDVNVKFSGEGCVDAVVLDGKDFVGDFRLNVTEMQTIDRLYVCNVTSFAGFDAKGNPITPVFTKDNVLGNGETGDQNGDAFGHGSYQIQDTGPHAPEYYEITYIDRNGDERTMQMQTDFADGPKSCLSLKFICFARGTLIECQDGPKAVEDLAPGDMVRTKDSGLQPIRWIASRKLGRNDFRRNPQIRPIRIRAGALGANTPAQDLVVSPQHRMLVEDWRCEAMFGETEMLVPAKALLNDHSITVDHQADAVEYFHFMFDAHEIVFANGVESESFHPGDFGLSTLDDAALEELFTVFPHLQKDVAAFGAPARPVLKVFEARAMMSA